MFLRPFLRIIRIESSLVGALSIFLPLYVRSDDLLWSLGNAAPLLFISICTYTANALDDLQKDAVNHPERPLPAGHLTPAFAAVLYFVSLTLAVLTIRSYVAPSVAFWYYALTIISISYGYLLAWLPGFKAPYVAVAMTIPVLIVADLYPGERALYFMAGAMLFHTLGREMCKDIVDRPGDAYSFMHRFTEKPLAVAAFSAQMIGLLLIGMQLQEPVDFIVFVVIMFLLGLSLLDWFKFARYKRAVVVANVQLVVALYFLT